MTHLPRPGLPLGRDTQTNAATKSDFDDLKININIDDDVDDDDDGVNDLRCKKNCQCVMDDDDYEG